MLTHQFHRCEAMDNTTGGILRNGEIVQKVNMVLTHQFHRREVMDNTTTGGISLNGEA